MIDKLDARLKEIASSGAQSVVAIDGLGGAGKSSTARYIAANYPGAFVVELDWFYLPRAESSGERRVDFDRLIREVLLPFKAKEPVTNTARYNWGYLAGKEEALEPFELELFSCLVLEGCESLSLELQEHIDIALWVDTPAEAALARGKGRDVNEYGLDPEKVDEAWSDWVQREQLLLAQDDRRARADIILESSLRDA